MKFYKHQKPRLKASPICPFRIADWGLRDDGKLIRAEGAIPYQPWASPASPTGIRRTAPSAEGAIQIRNAHEKNCRAKDAKGKRKFSFTPFGDPTARGDEMTIA
jgi:hypothetical protein